MVVLVQACYWRNAEMGLGAVCLCVPYFVVSGILV